MQNFAFGILRVLDVFKHNASYIKPCAEIGFLNMNYIV